MLLAFKCKANLPGLAQPSKEKRNILVSALVFKNAFKFR